MADDSKRKEPELNEKFELDFSAAYAAEAEKRESGLPLIFGDTVFKAKGVLPGFLATELAKINRDSSIEDIKKAALSLISEEDQERFAEFLEPLSSSLIAKIYSDLIPKLVGKVEDS